MLLSNFLRDLLKVFQNFFPSTAFCAAWEAKPLSLPYPPHVSIALAAPLAPSLIQHRSPDRNSDPLLPFLGLFFPGHADLRRNFRKNHRKSITGHRWNPRGPRGALDFQFLALRPRL